MASTKIKDLSSKSPIVSTDETVINDVAGGNVDKKATMGNIKTFCSDSPTLVTPDIGTPSAGVATNITGLPLSTGVTGTLPVANGGTGVTSKTGTGSVVLSNSPTLVTPALGTPASGTMTNVSGTSGITGLGTQSQDLEMGGNNIQNVGPIFQAEQAAADADAAGEGQWWTKTATPNVPMFTDDAGTDFEVASKTGTNAPKQSFIIAASDETTALTTGTAKATFRMPFAFTVTEVRASVTTAPTTSGTLTVDINEGGTSILSTKLTIDVTEKTSESAATPPVISDSSLADDAEMTIDIDAISGGATEAGLKVYIIGYQT